MKKAILAASLGTSCAEAERSSILPVEEALRRAFPGYEVRRAYSSRGILQRLRERGVFIESPGEALAGLRRDGWDEIIVVPTHILPGAEYARVKAAAGALCVSQALLETEDDLIWMAGLLDGIAKEEGQPLLLMGHGTEHAADEIYVRLRKLLPKDVFLACISGGQNLDSILPELEALPGRKLTLMPLMLAAGRHARRDMAGDGEGSWKSILAARGFDLRIRMQGLGALPEVQRRFAEKAKRAMES